jgi:hypothetical protein
MRKTTLLCSVLAACLSLPAAAQSPIPDSRVPGFGGSAAPPATLSPSATGSNVGSNVGAGATASPITNDALPPGNSASPPEIAEVPNKTPPLIGISRDLPVR